MIAPKKALYIFLDEGGNFDFSPSGTSYLTLTSVTRERPFPAYPELTELKYDIIESGRNMEYFHCAEDEWPVRNEVFKIISNHIKDFRVDSVIMEKRKANPSIRDIDSVYCKLMGWLLSYVFRGHRLTVYSEVIIITDRLPHVKKRSRLELAVKRTLPELLPPNVTYRFLHHDSKSNFYLQITDYCNWAIGRKWERKDDQCYKIVRPAIYSEFNVFQKGTTLYY